MNTESTWRNIASKPPQFPTLKGDIEADVVIIGAGITGLTLAHLLSETGKRVIVLEKGKIGDGTTGYSSNHLTTDIDFGYRNVKKKFSEDVMRIVAHSRVEAINTIENICNNENIQCDFSRVPGFLYAENEEKANEVEEEMNYAYDAGLEVEEQGTFDLPFNVSKIAVYKNQGIINTQKFLNGLAENISSKDNCEIYCHTPVLHVENSDKKVETATGSVTAQHIILATHIPQFINLLQTMVVPYRSYMISVKLPEGSKYPQGLYWDSKEPYHYTRSYKVENEEWLIIGGADHKTGHNGENHYNELEKYARDRYGNVKIEHQWSAQYYEPADGLPYIGKSPLSNVYVATGFSGDGLVYGVVAAIILKSLVEGNDDHEWIKAYDARRFTPLASAKKFIKHNVGVGKHLIKGLLQSEDLKNLSYGEGRIINYEGNKYAVTKDKAGDLIAVSAVCTHMGCVVQWNSQEYTWDCPCHGSRFENTGTLIEGPAVKGLEREEGTDDFKK